MRRPVPSLAWIAFIAVIGSFLAAGPVLAQGGAKRISEPLTSFEEVPALSTPGVGKFHARINNAGTAIAWELRYANLESTVDQAHIHFENATNNGPVVVFLCTNLGNGPVGTQACPAQPATITGIIEADDVLAGAAAQGIAATELGELIRAIRAGATYVNVHSATRGGGEIRGQLLDGHRGHGHDDD